MCSWVIDDCMERDVELVQTCSKKTPRFDCVMANQLIFKKAVATCTDPYADFLNSICTVTNFDFSYGPVPLLSNAICTVPYFFLWHGLPSKAACTAPSVCL